MIDIASERTIVVKNSSAALYLPSLSYLFYVATYLKHTIIEYYGLFSHYCTS